MEGLIKQVHIAIDIGASTGRLIAGWIDDGQLFTEEIHRFVTEDVFVIHDRVRDVYRYYEEIIHGIRQYAKNNQVQIVSIGVDAFGSDFGLTDKAGNLLMMPKSYRGLTFDDDIYQLADRCMEPWNIYEYNGNQCMLSDTLHQLVRLKENGDCRLGQGCRILFVADIFHYLLCGNRGVEHSLASYSRLWNQKTDKWEDSIFGAFGLPLTLQSDVVRCTETLGYVHRETADDMGLPYCPKVIAPASHDTACAAFAVPDDGNDWMFISSGSWSLIGMETEAPVISREGWEFNASNSSMPLRTNMFKKIVTGMWIVQMCQKRWEAYTFDDIVCLASRVQENNLYIDPDHIDFYRPSDMPLAISRNIEKRYGIKINPNQPGMIARIVFESLALKYCLTVRKLIHCSKKEIKKVYVLGGGSKNALLNQYTANALGLPVLTGVTEASSVGDLLCQLYGQGLLKNRREVKDILKRTYPVTTYRPENRETWKEKFEDFMRDAYEPLNVCSGRKFWKDS